VTTYSYDDNGNLLSRFKSDTDKASYTWDEENRLMAAVVTDGLGTHNIQYRYDADGVRVASIVDGVETRYLIDANRPNAQVLEEYTSDGTVRASYTYGLDLVSQERGSDRSFYYVDGLGSTRGLTNASGNVSDTYNYDAYGNLIGAAGSTVNNYLYAGEQYDPNLDDYYLRARYYDSETGRFSARDPFEGMLMEPLSLAKYPYVHGNPVNAIDPSGLFLEDSGAAINISSILSTFTYSLPYVAATAVGLSSGRSRQERLMLPVAIAITRECALTNDPDCRSGLPIVVYAAGNLEDHAVHINDAQKGFGNVRIQEQRSLLPAVLSRGLPQRTNPPWYNNTQYCEESARGDYENTFFQQSACDEYPLDSTNEGGLANYNLNRVSLKLVDLRESNRQGMLMRSFYRGANV
jgi:RHS repeat-associated protein